MRETYSNSTKLAAILLQLLLLGIFSGIFRKRNIDTILLVLSVHTYYKVSDFKSRLAQNIFGTCKTGTRITYKLRLMCLVIHIHKKRRASYVIATLPRKYIRFSLRSLDMFLCLSLTYITLHAVLMYIDSNEHCVVHSQ